MRNSCPTIGNGTKNGLAPTTIAAAVRASLPWLTAGTMAIGLPVIAAEPAASKDELEEVVVSGVRQSLQSAQEIKMQSVEIVDSITAEDISALPDRSVTEALQRVPGVAINRFAAGRDPDHFSVEGSGVVVRGLSYVRSEINGRDAFTANNGRGLSFADVPPELLVGVDVYKSPSASRIEGGIAGSVNLRTRRPFDSKENLLAFSAEANYADFVKDWSPTASALASYRWNTNAGEFGVLASGVYSQVRSRADRFQISNFATRTLYASGDVIPASSSDAAVRSVLFPRGAVLGTQEFDRERYGASGAFQWKNNDGNMEATIQFLRSDAREAWTEHTMEIATDNYSNADGSIKLDGNCGNNGICDSRRLPGTVLTFDDSGLFESGIITGATGWRADQNSDPRTPRYGLQSNTIHRDVNQRYLTNDLGTNFRWTINDNWALNVDYQHVNSSVKNLDAGIWGSTYQDVSIQMHGSGVPTVAFIPPGVCLTSSTGNCPTYFRAPHASYADPYNSFYRSSMDHIEDSTGTSDAERLDLERSFTDNDWLKSLRFGYRHAERDQTARFSTYNWGSLSEIWGGGGPVWFDENVPQNGNQPMGNYELFTFNNFFDGKTANPVGTSGRLFYAPNIANSYSNYATYVDYSKKIAAYWGGSWVPLAGRPGVVAGTPFLPGEINPVIEKNNAGYVELNFDHMLQNEWRLSGNLGVRYTNTDRAASGYQQFQPATYPTDASCVGAPTVTPWCALPQSTRDQARAFSNGALTPFAVDTKLKYWLPSLNVKLQLKDGWQLRGAYFKGVSPPDFGLTRAYYNVPALGTQAADISSGGGKPLARFNAGNPLLKPVHADNFDLTAEWYFADVGQLSAALFYKKLYDIRTNDVRRVTLSNNGGTFDAIVTTAINSDEVGKIKGVELAYQQTYDKLPGILSGLGLAANYTYIKSSNVPQSTLSETDPDVAAGRQSTIPIEQLPLENLSKHNINIQPFWEKGKWSVRAAYSWRSQFLLTVRDVIVPFQPIYNEATGQLDGSVFYKATDKITMGIQAVNILQETIKTSAVVNNQLVQAPRSWFLNDRRISFIIRGSF
jgi:TonB-dependent receptor